jgi:hypothetical protein
MRKAESRRPAPIRQIVLELPRQELERLEGLPDLSAVESFRVVHQLRFDPTRYAGICRVRFRPRTLSPASMVGHAGIVKVAELARLEDGSFFAYFEGKPTVGWARLARTSGVHLVPPFELTPERWRISAVGTPGALRRFSAALRGLRLSYEIRSLRGPELRGESAALPIDALTARQRETLQVAYREGYYDIPRRAGSARVAKVLGLQKSATVEHLRKAEKRLLDQLLRG